MASTATLSETIEAEDVLRTQFEAASDDDVSEAVAIIEVDGTDWALKHFPVGSDE